MSAPKKATKRAKNLAGLRFRYTGGKIWIEIVDPGGDVAASHKLTKRDALGLLRVAAEILT